MAKVDITKTELVWPGKYNEDGSLSEVPRVKLPFQVIETVNESRATREAKKVGLQTGLFDVYDGKEGDTFEAGWRNKLIWGDNLLVMGSLLEKFAGKIDLIYIDPPFATGADFSFTAAIGESGVEIHKEQSAIEEKAYRDTWGAGTASYLAMMRERVTILFDLLSDKGSIFVHCDWHVSYLLRCILDERFGSDRFLNEIVWYYYNKFQGNVNRFASNHDVILWYSKSPRYQFKALKEKRAEGTVKQIKRKWDKDAGRIVNMKGDDGKVQYQETDEKTVDDVWRLSMLQPADQTQNVGYPTQKPQAVLERIIEAASMPGDLVADFFCGSGTTLVTAEKMKRRWIGCDLGRWATHVTRKRLQGIENCRPFEVLNLGKYERQYWQGVTFGETKTDSLNEQALYEYLAFILKLYGAQPVAGLIQLHGKKNKAMVHIGAVDAPVTIAEIEGAVEECARLKQSELHVLGWEWEMGLYDLMVESAKKKAVKLLLLQIPREAMEQQTPIEGEVRFFELAYLEAKIQLEKRAVTATLKDFVIPNTELIPEEVRTKVKKWSDYIDYWAIDWDFQNDTFMQGWVAYRTRKDRNLPLVSDAHTYEKPGKHRILVKVIDIFGNDTSQAFDVEVR
jgi:adenine-specific DNA-methyltransferase